MIISENPIPKNEEFTFLLNNTIEELNKRAKNSPKEIGTLAGNRLEPFIKEIMSEQAVGSVFENSIILKSGVSFPDIIANKYFGVEVKSTTQNHWKTTGNSVLESTRVDGVERIYMLFGKLGKPIEFRFRQYEECLSEIVVTHSPRYLIDMNLSKGSTIFDKMNIQYDDLRSRPNPIKPIVAYYKSKLKHGEDIWWIDQNENVSSSNLIIKIWSNLNSVEKNDLRLKSMAFFPEVFSNSGNKFGRLAIWLVTNEGVVCPNIRDLFTAGGKANLIIGKKTYKKVPKIFKNLFDNLFYIIEVINRTSVVDLKRHWNYKTSEKTKVNDWVNLISSEARKMKDANHLDIKEMISEFLLNQ